MIDVILGALTVMLTYFVMIKLIRRFKPPTGSRLEEAVVMFTAAVTAFMAGFADEFWTNSIETETYMPTLFMQILALWLTLRWNERKNDPRAVRYLFLAAYIIGLGNGVHLTVLLIAPTVFLIVLFGKPHWFNNSKLWLYGALFLIGAALIKIYAGLAILYFTMASFAFVAPVILYFLYKSKQEIWKITLLSLILCGSLYIIGYSVYPTVMVRALKKPAINEGNPDNWKRYKLYMERDQYGQENMYKGMFFRNSEFSYQFKFMFLRYFIQQFPVWGPIVNINFENDKSPDSAEPTSIIHYGSLSVLILSLLLYGFYTHAHGDWKSFLALMLFFLASSIGLVLYLNMENPQVRDRSYFFLGSFYIIMVWIGMGILGLIYDITDWLNSKNKSSLVTPVTIIIMIIFATLPPTAALSRHINENFSNFKAHDRSQDWIPWDYGYNILISCEKNAVLFTNGDNDTFPLWYLQEVEGIRKDVRVINLSLLNTDWYILQLKNEGMTLPIEYSAKIIENRLCSRTPEMILKRKWPLEGSDVEAAGITWKLPVGITYNVSGSAEPLGLLRIQDVMVWKIIDWLNWERPIYFAVTVAKENKIGLDNYLAMEGMVYRLMEKKGPQGDVYVNIPVLDKNVFEKYQYRSLTDTNVYNPPNTLKLVTNYFIGFVQLCERKTPNDLNKRVMLYQLFAARMTDTLDEFIEWETTTSEFKENINNRVLIYRVLGIGNKQDMLNKFIDDEISSPELINDFDASFNFGTMLLSNKLNSQSSRFFKEVVTKYPNNPKALKAYLATLYVLQKYDDALKVLDEIVKLTPDDETTWREPEQFILFHN